MQKNWIPVVALILAALLVGIGYFIYKDLIEPSLIEIQFLFQILIAAFAGMLLGLGGLFLRGIYIRQENIKGTIPADKLGHHPLVRMPNGSIYEAAQPWPEHLSIGAGALREMVKQQEERIVEAPALLPPPLPRATQSFLDLMPQIGPGRLFLGFDRAGLPVWAAGMEEILHWGMIGRSQRGKTTYERMLLAQYVLLGIRPIIFDGHGSLTEEMKQFFPGDVYWRARDIDPVAASWLVKIDERLERYGEDSRSAQSMEPIAFFSDEWHRFYRLCPNVIELESMCLAESAKVKVWSGVAGQSLPAYMFGQKGSGARDLFETKIVKASSAEQCRLLGFETTDAFKALLEEMETGSKELTIISTGAKRPQLLAAPDAPSRVIEEAIRRTNPGRLVQRSYSFSRDFQEMPEEEPLASATLTVLPPLPMKKSAPLSLSLSAQERAETVKLLPAEERERERMRQAILENPGMSASAICSMLGISSNKTGIVRRLKEEMAPPETAGGIA